MGDTVTAEIVKRRDRGLLDQSLNIRGVAFTNGGINFKYAKLRLAQWALRLGFHEHFVGLKYSILTISLEKNPALVR